jgi:hypothetical protein
MLVCQFVQDVQNVARSVPISNRDERSKQDASDKRNDPTSFSNAKPNGKLAVATPFQGPGLGMNGTVDSGFAYSASDPLALHLPSGTNTASHHMLNTPVSQMDSAISVPQDPMNSDDLYNLEATDELLHTFYDCFYPAHPFIIPRKLYLKNPALMPNYLKSVMRFVASHYSRGTNQDALQRRARLIMSDQIPDTGFKVQGLLLFAMVTHARLDPARGAKILEQAVSLALQIGMNRCDYSYRYGEQNSTLQESWRRTWWDLFIVEGLFSALRGPKHALRLHSIATDVPLPGSCEAYNDCQPVGHLRTLSEMQDRTFSEDAYPWSSFAYKVEATRIMHAILQLSPDGISVKNAQVEAIDSSISSFLLSLPPEKREVVERHSTIDEVLFGAHMIIQWAAITVHRPRSGLTAVKTQYQTACTKEEMVGMPALGYISHKSKALRAANALSSLISIPSQLEKHTPCFSCAIALAATVQLPAYAIENNADEAQAMKERVRLAISALSSIAEVWPLASVVKSQLAKFARELFLKPPSTAWLAAKSLLAPNPDLSSTQSQVDFDEFLNNDQWLKDLVQYGVTSSAEMDGIDEATLETSPSYIPPDLLMMSGGIG